MNLIERISSSFNRLADRTNQALDEGRLRLDLMRARRRRDQFARDLGYLVFKERNKGVAPGEGEVDFHVRRIADVEAEMEKLEQQLSALRESRSKPAGTSPSADATGDGGAADAAPPTTG